MTPTLSFDRGTLLLAPNGADCRPLLGAASWRHDGRLAGPAWRADALAYRRVASAARRLALPLADAVRGWDEEKIAWPAPDLPPLRPEQARAVQAWSREKQGRGIVVLPTGAGKTLAALSIIARTGRPALIVVPTRPMMYHWHRDIKAALGFDAGLIGDTFYQVRAVSVATYRSAAIRMPEMGHSFGLLVCDEVHHLAARGYAEAARMCAAPFRLGLTATLERPDGRHRVLDELIGPVCFRAGVADCAAALAPHRVVRVPVRLSGPEQARHDALGARVGAFFLHRRAQDAAFGWPELLSAAAARDPAAREVLCAWRERERIASQARAKLDALEGIFARHRGERTLVFCATNAMAREVTRRFLVPCLLHHCGKREREWILDGFRAGRFLAVASNRVLDEGINVPEVKVGVILGGSDSVRRARQRLGRLLRRCGGARATLYEVVVAGTREVKRAAWRRKHAYAHPG